MVDKYTLRHDPEGNTPNNRLCENLTTCRPNITNN